MEKYHGVTAEGIVESALNKVGIIEDCGYDNLVISIKSSDVMMCVRAHEILALKANYPLHVGITESGTVNSGNIKSAIGLGIMLNQGIGDTIRVSLTGDPVEEIRSAKLILRTLGLRKGGLCGKRSGRSKRGRYRHCRRYWRGTSDQERRDCEKGAGRGAVKYAQRGTVTLG